MAAETSSKTESMKKELETLSTEQLSKDIAALKTDLAQVVASLRELGVQGRDTAVAEGRRRYEIARTEASQQVDHLRRSAEDLGHQATEAIRERPGTALLVAAGIGMLFGFLTARK